MYVNYFILQGNLFGLRSVIFDYIYCVTIIIISHLDNKLRLCFQINVIVSLKKANRPKNKAGEMRVAKPARDQREKITLKFEPEIDATRPF